MLIDLGIGILIKIVLLLGKSVIYYFKPNKELVFNLIQDNPRNVRALNA